MTLIEKVRKGTLPLPARKSAQAEGLPAEEIADLVLRGLAVIPWNPRHAPRNPCGIGRGLRTKINVNLGTSRDFADVQQELAKVKITLKYGGDTLMDLSTGGDLVRIRRRILAATPIPLGTVPIYQAAIKAIDRRGSIVRMTEEDGHDQYRKSNTMTYKNSPKFLGDQFSGWKSNI